MSTMLKNDGFWHSQCVVLKQHVGLYVESKLTNVESKLLLQLLLCGFNICLFLFDQTAKIDPTEVSTCRGSFGGFKSTCFQLDRAARIKTTGISYFSCNRSASPKGIVTKLAGCLKTQEVVTMRDFKFPKFYKIRCINQQWVLVIDTNNVKYNIITRTNFLSKTGKMLN